MKKLFQTLNEHLDRGEDTVLISVVASSGSAPRGAGAHMLVDQQGICAGTIGGGAVEHRATEIGGQVLTEKGGCQEHFFLRTNKVEDLGMVCGGDVTVWFQYLSCQSQTVRDAAALASASFAAGTPCWMVLGPGGEGVAPTLTIRTSAQSAGDPIASGAAATFPEKPGFVAAEGRSYYAEPLLGSSRVFIFGGGHVAQALVPVLASVEFRCVILEDRPEFCHPDLFPGAEETQLIQPEDWEKKLEIGPEDYICIMTRGHKNDTDCEAFALNSPARYIGVIGSRKKIAAVNARLKERGFTDEDLKRITTPIGLPILAETPAEIAISIAAQMIYVRAGGK